MRISWALLLFLTLPFAENAHARRHVVIVSIDGLRPDAISAASAPVLQELVRISACTLKAQTILPSLTLPNHASMLSGVDTSVHGITWNEYRPAEGPIKVATIFEVARRAGLTTAMFVGKDKFRQLLRPGSLDIFEIPDYESTVVAARAAQFFEATRPDLMFVHLADVDGAGHAFGWMSWIQLQAVEKCDAALGVLRETIRRSKEGESTALIVTSDHGGHDYHHGLGLPVDTTIPWMAIGSGIRGATTIEKPVGTCDTAATALALLGLPVPVAWKGRPVREALARGVLEAVATTKVTSSPGVSTVH